MQLYINDQQIKGDYNGLSKTELLHKVRKNLGNEIIESIYIDDTEVNLDYFNESRFKVSDVKRLTFVTKTTGMLIKETLLEAQEYLPKLKEGLLDTSKLLREEELQDANYKYQLCLDGIGWYTQVLNHILSIIGDEEFNKEGKKLLAEFNEIITKAMVSAQKDKLDKVGDTLEFEVVDFIDRFIDFNERLLED